MIRQASLTTDLKVFDLGTKRIVATGTVTENYEEKFGGDREYSFLGKKLSRLPSHNETLNSLSSKVAARVVAKIAPTKVYTVVKFDDGTKFGLGFGGSKMLKRGTEFAKRGAWEEAIDIWKDVIKADPTKAAAYYNLGVAYENFRDLKNLKIARDMYKKAAKYGDNRLYIDAIARIKPRLETVKNTNSKEVS